MDKKNPNKKELKMGFGRMKRIVANVQLGVEGLDDVFHFKYPRFSYFIMIVIIFEFVLSLFEYLT